MLFYLIPSSERGTCGLMQAKQARTGTRASWSAGRHESLALSFCFFRLGLRIGCPQGRLSDLESSYTSQLPRATCLFL